MTTAGRAAAADPGMAGALDVARIREDFPALHQTVHGKPLVYLDNAATTQKPRAVIEAIRRYYEVDCSNIHRGVHTLSERATRAYEMAREKVQRFLNARRVEEIVFTRGTTEAINLVAATFAQARVGAGDEVLISAMEHHSNIVPWQMLCEEKGAALRVAPMTDAGELILEEVERLIGPRTRIVAMVHVSNALGTVNPIREIIALAHARGVPVLIDGAQAVSHMKIDVQALDVDFYAFSSHKLYGPTGVGVLYGKHEHLEAMPPYQGGGDMIRSVTFEKTTYAPPPHRFEAGTPNISGGIGLGAAIDYFTALGAERVAPWEHDLLAHATEMLSAIPGLRIVGTAREKMGLVSFVVDGIHPHDLGTIVDQEGIAIRTGHHCSQPVMKRFGCAATARASFSFYNTHAEVDALGAAIHRAIEVMG